MRSKSKITVNVMDSLSVLTDETLIKSDATTIAKIAIGIGELLLHYGGEVHRVEDAINRICLAYGAEKADVFVIPSLIQLQVTMKDGSVETQIMRLSRNYIHLARLEKANSLSRAVCKNPIPLDEVEKEIQAVKKYKPLPKWLCYIGGFLGTGAFTMFFGGTWRDALAASCIGFMMVFLQSLKLSRISLSDLGRIAVTSLFAGILSVLSVQLGIAENTDMVIIGTIMLEVPGIALGNAARDILYGDTFSGAFRFIQSLLKTLVMALCYMAALALCDLIFGGISL